MGLELLDVVIVQPKGCQLGWSDWYNHTFLHGQNLHCWSWLTSPFRVPQTCLDQTVSSQRSLVSPSSVVGAAAFMVTLGGGDPEFFCWLIPWGETGTTSYFLSQPGVCVKMWGHSWRHVGARRLGLLLHCQCRNFLECPNLNSDMEPLKLGSWAESAKRKNGALRVSTPLAWAGRHLFMAEGVWVKGFWLFLVFIMQILQGLRLNQQRLWVGLQFFGHKKNIFFG